jgi:hypothetical protein
MINTILIAIGVFALAILGLGLGVLLSKKPLRGSCGGLGALRAFLNLAPCESCAEDPEALKESCSRARKEASRREPMDV